MNIEIKNLKKSYDDEKIFENFNLKLYDQKVNCIIGGSGCGKSTLLNILAQLISIDDGEILGVCREDTSYIFQEDRLIEWLTVEQNLNLTLKKYYNILERKGEICNMLSSLGIENVKNKYPSELSGGMKQRVNIARAFLKPSKVILMDEPFKSLDYTLKYNIIDEFKDVILKENRMVILVTHDVDEAIYFEGNIIVLGDRPVKIKGFFSENLKKSKDEIISLIV
ncbi:ABC transporter ATP-binding protein [Clostridium uliginosum]|uniref:NitT/TauT family transport system ATP-binding protein n=1 Tax=Clostridium uliginosum TaxID=119641 RepID=A0A1I1KFG8_9CLOT|nr:ABC transporter ATP-binding protein [Clostridium uliginosum]SFC56200.1 NitT/TauT family transport system ATP-binding protein [Clostridium uliginosum]